MAGGGASNSNAPKARKRVEAETAVSSSLVRAKDGSAFTKCEECHKDVPVALISFHSCSLDAKIKMNLESQVVEKPAESKKKPAADRKSTLEPKLKKAKTEKKAKKGKDPNKPKRPTTAFFLFMDDFRRTFKEENPDSKGIKEVAKHGGEKWKSMTEEEKKPYMDKAAELKAEYEKAKEANNADNAEDEGASEKDEGKETEEKEDDDTEAAEKEDEEKEAADKELEDELSDPE